MFDRDKAVAYLEANRQQLHDAVDGLSEAQLRFQSVPDRWSVADCVEHIALVEELRRDLPMVRDRIDREADAMQEAVDPHAMLEALERASKTESPKNQETSHPPSAAVTPEE